MRSKSPLALMEQVVMVLVFALAAALCLQVFVLSDRMSGQNQDTDRAVLLAQNTAETIKACGGVDGAQEILGGETEQMMWCSYYYEDLTPAPDRESSFYEVDVLPGNSGVEGLGQANIEVFRWDGNEGLFALTVAWQEVSGYE